MADTNMTVRFLKGTLASLDLLLLAKSGYNSGAFYLTTDSDRLYFALSDTELVPLNQFIRTITSADLPINDAKPGDYYYLADLNILMIRNPQNTGWTQINAPSINYDFNFGENSLTLKGSDNSQDVFHYLAVTSGTGIGEGVVVNTGKTSVDNDTMQVGHKAYTTAASTIAASQTPNAGATFDIVKGVLTTNGHVTGYEYATVKLPDAIANTTYQLSNNAGVADTTPAANIALKGSDGGYTNVELEAGTALTVAADGANKIKYSHANITRTDSATANGGALNPASVITVVDAVKSDDLGHVINVQKKSYTLPQDVHLTSLALGLNDKSKLVATLSDNSEVETAKSFYYNITVDGTSNEVINQGNLGSFYSATKVNELIEETKNSVDALTYRGTLGTGGTVATLPTTDVHIGDVYKVSVAGTYAGQEADVGDLFIAQGTETNGVITSDLTWTYVPSGDDTDTHYELVRNGNTVNLQASTDPAGTYSGGSFEVSGDDKWIQVSNLGISHIGPDRTSAAALTPTNATETINDGGTFTALTSVSADSKGHITSLGEKTFTIPKDSKYDIGSAVNETKITLTGKTGSGAVGESSNVELLAGTLIALDGSVANKITINHGQITTSAIVGTGTINANREFSAITDVTVTNGHVENYTTSTFTLPADADSKYALSGASVASASLAADIAVATSAAVAITATLTGTASGAGEETTAVFNMQSKSLAIGGSNSVAQIELVWGTF